MRSDHDERVGAAAVKRGLLTVEELLEDLRAVREGAYPDLAAALVRTGRASPTDVRALEDAVRPPGSALGKTPLPAAERPLAGAPTRADRPPKGEASRQSVATARFGQGPQAAAAVATGTAPAKRLTIPGLHTPVALVQIDDEAPLVRIDETTPDGRYEIGQEVGRGGMGIVRVARDERIGRRVALKTLLPEEAADEALTAALIQEAQTTGQLAHPNIIPIHDLGVLSGGRAYYTMRLVEGISLADIIARLRIADRKVQQEYGLIRRLTLFQQVCMGLHYAHSRGVIHCDVKPANILLGKFGEVYILDWGIARVIGREGRLQPGTGILSEPDDRRVIGTPFFMSPEQASGQVELLDARTDIYALGIILYQLLALALPFDAPDPDAYLAIVRQRAVPPPNARSAGGVIGADLEAIVLKACAFDRRDRYESARALYDDIAEVIEGHRERERRDSLAGQAVQAGQLAEARYRALGARRQALLDEIALTESEQRTVWVSREQRETLGHLRFELQNVEIGLARAFSTAVTEYGRAMGYVPDQELARQKLAALYWERFQQAEREQDFVNMTYFGDQAEALQPPAPAGLAGELGAPAQGEVSIRTLPEGAQLSVLGARDLAEDPGRAEGRPLGQAPLTDVRLPTGIRLLIARKDGYRDAQRVIYVRHNAKQYVLMTLQPWSAQVSMVGRESELAHVTGVFESAVSGRRPEALLVTGEAGMGKTRLQEAFGDYLDVRQGDVVFIWVRSAPRSQGVPFSTLASALRFRAGLRTSDAPETIRRKLCEMVRTAYSQEGALALSPADERAVCTTADTLADLPSFVAQRPDAARTPDPTRRERFYAALDDYFTRLAAWLPVAFLVREMQSVDASSREFFERLLQRPGAGPVFVFGAATSTGADERLAALRGFGLGARLPLPPLTPPAVRQLLAVLLKGRPAPEIAEAVRERGRGNPYLVEEWARRLVDDGLLRQRDDRWLPAGPRALDLPTVDTGHFTAQRIARLPEAERAVLQRAAVVGLTFWETAIVAMGIGEPRAALEALASCDMVQASPHTRYPGDSEYNFRLDVIWRVAYQSLAPAAARELHLTAARWLGERGAGTPSERAQIAYHYERALDAPRAVAAYEGLAGECADLGAFEEAVYHYDRALAHPMQPERRAALRAARAAALQARRIPAGADPDLRGTHGGAPWPSGSSPAATFPLSDLLSTSEDL